MKKTKEDAALTRTTVLEAAFRIFKRKGYSRTSLVEVATEANLTRGAVYWHFGSKYELFRALLQQSYQQVEHLISSLQESALTPLEKIRGILTGLLTIIGDTPEFKAMDEILIFGADGDDDMKNLYTEHHEFVKQLRLRMETMLAAARDQGEIAPGLDIKLVGMAMHSFISGIHQACLCSDWQVPIKEQAHRLTDIFISGIMPR